MEVKLNRPKPKPKIIQKSLEEYYFDRMGEDAAAFEPHFEGLYYTPATEVENARREMACLDNQLVQARTLWHRDKTLLDARWNAAIKRYDEIQESIPKFNGYYRDSFAKRERALSTYTHEKGQVELKQREICRLKKELEKLEEIKEDANKRLEKFSVFKAYLSKVRESSAGEYQDVREIIDRFSILAEARTNLSDRNEQTRDTILRRQKALDTDMLMKSNEVLAYRNYLSELLEYHDSLKEQVQTLEDNLLRIKTTAAQRTMIIGQIKMAIQNLYHQVCKHMHRAAKLAPSDVLGQLVDIRISVQEMSKLSKDIKHMLKAAFVAAEAEKTAKEKAQRKSEERHRRIDKMNKRGNLDVRELFGLPQVRPENSKIDFKKMLAHPNLESIANVPSNL